MSKSTSASTSKRAELREACKSKTSVRNGKSAPKRPQAHAFGVMAERCYVPQMAHHRRGMVHFST